MAGEPPRACAPRRARRGPGIHSEALGAGFVPIWWRSCVVPAALLLGVVPSQRTASVTSGSGRGFCFAQARVSEVRRPPAHRFLPRAALALSSSFSRECAESRQRETDRAVCDWYACMCECVILYTAHTPRPAVTPPLSTSHTHACSAKGMARL